MKRQFLLSSALVLSVISSISVAEGVPHTFATGEPAVAAEMNENFQSVVDLANTSVEGVVDLGDRVTVLESNVSPLSRYQGFSTPFSAAGEPRNVVVYKSEDSSGVATYSMRMRYANSDGAAIAINGIERVFNYLAVYGSISQDVGGTISVGKYIEGMDDPVYTQYSGLGLTYDPASLIPSVYSSSDIVDRVYDNGAVRMLVRNKADYLGGVEVVKGSVFLYEHRILSSGYEVNGISFGNTPILIEKRDPGSSRIKVQGIGVVEVIPTTFGPSREVIYYHVDGQTGGSLVGTPLEEGTNLHTLFFLN
jgi:hypothetical protein